MYIDFPVIPETNRFSFFAGMESLICPSAFWLSLPQNRSKGKKPAMPFFRQPLGHALKGRGRTRILFPDICIREKGRGMYSPLPFISFYYSFAGPLIPLCSSNGYGWNKAIEF